MIKKKYLLSVIIAFMPSRIVVQTADLTEQILNEMNKEGFREEDFESFLRKIFKKEKKIVQELANNKEKNFLLEVRNRSQGAKDEEQTPYSILLKVIAAPGGGKPELKKILKGKGIHNSFVKSLFQGALKQGYDDFVRAIFNLYPLSGANYKKNVEKRKKLFEETESSSCNLLYRTSRDNLMQLAYQNNIKEVYDFAKILLKPKDYREHMPFFKAYADYMLVWSVKKTDKSVFDKILKMEGVAEQGTYLFVPFQKKWVLIELLYSIDAPATKQKKETRSLILKMLLKKINIDFERFEGEAEGKKQEAILIAYLQEFYKRLNNIEISVLQKEIPKMFKEYSATNFNPLLAILFLRFRLFGVPAVVNIIERTIQSRMGKKETREKCMEQMVALHKMVGHTEPFLTYLLQNFSMATIEFLLRYQNNYWMKWIIGLKKYKDLVKKFEGDSAKPEEILKEMPLHQVLYFAIYGDDTEIMQNIFIRFDEGKEQLKKLFLTKHSYMQLDISGQVVQDTPIALALKKHKNRKARPLDALIRTLRYKEIDLAIFFAKGTVPILHQLITEKKTLTAAFILQRFSKDELRKAINPGEGLEGSSLATLIKDNMLLQKLVDVKLNGASRKGEVDTYRLQHSYEGFQLGIALLVATVLVSWGYFQFLSKREEKPKETDQESS